MKFQKAVRRFSAAKVISTTEVKSLNSVPINNCVGLIQQLSDCSVVMYFTHCQRNTSKQLHLTHFSDLVHRIKLQNDSFSEIGLFFRPEVKMDKRIGGICVGPPI
jgi:hypothetical protein